MNKKTFKANLEEMNNPALQFISEQNNEQLYNHHTMQKISLENYNYNHKREVKNRRVQLLIKPSLYYKIKEKANAESVSVNETINNILNDAFNE